MSPHTRVLLAAATSALFVGPVHAADDRARVSALADRYVEAYQENFPVSYGFSGLTPKRSDGIDINAPAEIAQWHALLQGMSAELASIKPEAFPDQPEWVTWHFLNHALKQDAATAVCRNELWANVTALGWVAELPQIARLQPVGTAEARTQALTRWRRFGPWFDQEIANLREGQRLGYSATVAAVQSTLGQLDKMLAGAPEKSDLMNAAERDKSPTFLEEWTQVISGTVWPALTRYRNFLREEYQPHARQSPSIAGMPQGRDCYRGLIFSAVTVDADPGKLYDVAVKEVERERAVALRLGRKIYGDKARDWKTLAELIRAEPNSGFANAAEIRAYTERTYNRAYAAAGRMVLTPPVGQVKLEPFPEFQQASAPGGQYSPAADDGSRGATYYYRNVPQDLYRSSLQNVILHETLPGHHLQLAFLAEHGRKGNHPIGRILYFGGPSEGWATYAEDFAYEIGLYDSDVDFIGRQMSSITPMMVVDLGLQVKGWSTEQAAQYLAEAMPLRTPERAKESVALISSIPGFALAYPLGGMQWHEMRDRAERKLGKRFDVRAFHQALLEDGMLPFAALNAKTDRWIAAGGKEPISPP
jgi:uncharacterized protein (DUF885 family)